jgi:transglutaminase-like putative cysteine protease
MANDDQRRALPAELGVATLVIAAAIPLGRLFRTGDVIATSISSVAVGTTVAWALRRLRAPALVSVFVSIAAFLWFASFAFFRETLFGPFPSGHTLSMIWTAMTEAIRRSQTDVAPVASTPAFLCLTSFAVWATAWLADDAAIKLRHPMLAIGVTIPLYVLPGTIIEGTQRWLDAGVYLAAAMWVLFSDERFRLSRWGRVVGAGVPGWRPGLAARMGVAAVFIALVATPVLPGFGAPPRLHGNGGNSRTTLNPLVSIRGSLGKPEEVEVFDIRTSVLGYWRLTALDRFDGTTWTSAPQRAALPVSGRTILPQNPASTVRLVQNFEIKTLGGPWLPAAYEAVRVDGVKGAAEDADSRTVISARDLRRGMKYRVESRVPRVTYEELDLSPPTNDPLLARYKLLPRSPLTDRVAFETRRILRSKKALDASPFRKAVVIQNYLRTFTYDENVLLTHTITDIVDFLVNDKTGYCEQFATAMAVMARTVDLPSRVAIGFAGGTPDKSPDEYIVTSRNAHAWVEIFLDGFGWVPFEPTPRSDAVTVPSYTSPARATPEPEPTPTTQETATPSAAPTTLPSDPAEPKTGNTEPGTRTGFLIPTGLAAAGLLLLLALVLPVAAIARRALRRSRARTVQERISLRYLDFLDWCAATGSGRTAGETPLEHARRLADDASESDTAVASLARLALGAVYAPPNGIDEGAAARLARAARDELSATLSGRTRMLARLGWGWWRSDPASRPVRRERAIARVSFR